LEARQERWGTTGIARDWFAEEAGIVGGVRGVLRYNSDEAGVGLREARKVVCLKDMKLFRIKIGKMPHVVVFPAFNRFGHGPPLFIVLPRFISAQRRFAAHHRGRLYLTQSKAGWASGAASCEFAEWLCEWVDAYRAERGWDAERAVSFLDQAPTRGTPTLCESVESAM
jgi:hypothetical protein